VGPDSFGKLGVFRFNLGYFTMKHLFLICLVVAAFDSHADDVMAGRAKAETVCAICHGPRGIAALPNAPNLAGQQALYMSEQLRNYRSGKRQNEVMNMIAKTLTDTDIVQLSAWFSAIKVTVEEP
jgi:cytochrome c553